MVTWQTDRGTLGPSFLYHEHGKICLRLIVRQIVRLRLRVRLRRVHKANLVDFLKNLAQKRILWIRACLP